MKRLLAATTIALASAATPAAAQIAPGISGSSSSRSVQMEDVWRELGFFGRCIAGSRTADSLAMLRAEMGSAEEAGLLKRLVEDRTTNCPTDFGMRLPGPLFRGAIAEGLYDRRVPLPQDLRWTPLPAGSPVPTFSHIARCYLPGNEERVRPLIENTQPGSRREAKAMEGIMPGFRACLPAARRNRSFNITQVRLRLAETLNRLGATRRREEAAK